MNDPPWTEVYRGGSPQAEQVVFSEMAAEMARVGGRPLHAKTIALIANASLVMDSVMPAELMVGHFHPGAVLGATIRLSNAAPVQQADGAPDVRGLALRLDLADGRIHDLLFANIPASLLRDAEQFFVYSMALHRQPEHWLARLAARFGEEEGHRIAARFRAGIRLCPSLACETFWSGCALLWGSAPVRLSLRPLASPRLPGDHPIGPNGLRTDLVRRLRMADVRYRLAVQPYLDERHTPVEDAASEWDESLASPVEIATVVLPRQRLRGREGAGAGRIPGRLAFNRWNAPPPFRPLGSLNRLRRHMDRLAQGKDDP